MNRGINITRTDVRPVARSASQLGTRGFQPGVLPQALFGAELLARGLRHVAQASFRGECTEERLAQLCTPVLVRADEKFNEVEAVVEFSGGVLALIDGGYGQLRVDVAAPNRRRAAATVATLRRAFETPPLPDEQVSMAFWMRSGDCGEVRHRDIDAPSFDQIRGNYANAVRQGLDRLIALREPERGRLILWRGEPGTGKSHALRAVARAWSRWCSAHFILDPEQLLGHGGGYMLDVLSWEGDDDGRWRLLILEDAGELIASDARAVAGQALSRLLNIADGLLGQGTRTLLLITTNEPLKRLHPATLRPGRCLADIEFTALPAAEANAWLAERDREPTAVGPMTLAELYGCTDGEPLRAEPETEASGFGFARVLTRR
jgi:hypothetical protein